MNPAIVKYVAGAGLFLLWTALVVTGHADPDLIQTIKYALGALMGWHAIANLQLVQAPPATPAQPIPRGNAYPTVPLQERP